MKKIRVTLAAAVALFTLSLSMVTVSAATADAVQAIPTQSTVLVDGVDTAFDAYNIYDNNYFKLRDIAYILNGTDAQFEITWDGTVNAINMISGDSYTAVSGEMSLGDGTVKSGALSTDTVYLNGVVVELTAYKINDNNYFKLRDLGEALGFEVDWDGTNVIVNSVFAQEAVEDSYTYTMPAVEQPSATGELSVDYLSQMMLYMMVNDIDSYSCEFSGVTGQELVDQGIYALASEAFDKTKTTYACLGAFYENVAYQLSTVGKSPNVTTTLTLSLGDDDLGYFNKDDIDAIDNTAIYAYKADFIAGVNQLAAELYADGTFDPDDTDYNNALALYRWCAYNLAYDTTCGDISYTGYGALYNGTAVCQGYTSLFTALCNALGIQCVGVGGQAGGDDHIWNYVNLDGTWYYVDVTWGDPVPNRANYCNEAYFALTYAEISKTHTFDY